MFDWWGGSVELGARVRSLVLGWGTSTREEWEWEWK